MNCMRRSSVRLVSLVFLTVFALVVPFLVPVPNDVPSVEAAAWSQTITPLGSGFESSYPGYWVKIKTQNRISCSTDAGRVIYTRTRTPPHKNNVDWARWRPNLPTDGVYRVSVYIPKYTHKSPVTTRARYTITYADGTKTVLLNQNQNLCNWVSLGDYRFKAGRSGSVYMGDYTGDNPYHLIAADGVKFERVDVPPPPPPSNGKNLNVRYVDQVYVQQEPGVSWNLCGPSSMAMLLHYEGKEKRDVLYDRQPTLDLWCKVTTKPTECKIKGKGSTDINKMRNVLTERGIRNTIDWSPTFTEISKSIDSGHPVILGVEYGRGHILVVTGYKKNPDTVIVNDPYGGYSWWTDPERKGTNKYTGTPQLKGQQVQYRYGSTFSGKYAIIVSNVSQASIAETMEDSSEEPIELALPQNNNDTDNGSTVVYLPHILR